MSLVRYGASCPSIEGIQLFFCHSVRRIFSSGNPSGRCPAGLSSCGCVLAGGRLPVAPRQKYRCRPQPHRRTSWPSMGPASRCACQNGRICDADMLDQPFDVFIECVKLPLHYEGQMWTAPHGCSCSVLHAYACYPCRLFPFHCFHYSG